MSTTNNDTVRNDEQIKNKSGDVNKFYDWLKIYLEKDKFNLFKARSKLEINRKIEVTNTRIQKLIDLKIKVKAEIDRLISTAKLLKSKNFELKEELSKKLDINNEN